MEFRGEWAFWRRTAPLYRFGRTELLPIRFTEEGIGRYVGKYLGKHYAVRKPEDKGARLVGYSQGWRMATTRFSWSTPGAREWRRWLRMFAFITALIRAGTLRMRPILMTSIIAVLALLPVALGLGEGAAMQTPFAISIISGLCLAVPLVLLVTPALYLLVSRPGAKRLSDGAN